MASTTSSSETGASLHLFKFIVWSNTPQDSSCKSADALYYPTSVLIHAIPRRQSALPARLLATAAPPPGAPHNPTRITVSAHRHNHRIPRRAIPSARMCAITFYFRGIQAVRHPTLLLLMPLRIRSVSDSLAPVRWHDRQHDANRPGPIPKRASTRASARSPRLQCKYSPSPQQPCSKNTGADVCHPTAQSTHHANVSPNPRHSPKSRRASIRGPRTGNVFSRQSNMPHGM